MTDLPTLIGRYDGFLVDLWGVIHDGSKLYPGVLDTLHAIQQADKPLVFLSNAPRVAAKASQRLGELGIGPGLYRGVVTSGQVAHDWLRDATPFGKNYYYLGPGKDEDIISDLPDYVKVPSADDADFILCTGYEYDFQPHEEVLPTLARLHAAELPMVCTNPDLEVVKQDGTRQLCAGEVAAAYERMGGHVTYIGKPHASVYAVCREMIGPGRLLAVGDNPLTDIKGANAVNIDSLLISGGILAGAAGSHAVAEQALVACREAGVQPTYILPAFTLE